MRGIEAAGAEEANGHARAGAHEAGEGLAVCGDKITAIATFAFLGGVSEGEDKLGVSREEGKAVGGGVGEEELLS